MLVKVPPRIQKIFATMGFDLIFRIFSDEAAAWQALPTSELPDDGESLISSRYQA
jgi:hypothetical protein